MNSRQEWRAEDRERGSNRMGAPGVNALRHHTQLPGSLCIERLEAVPAKANVLGVTHCGGCHNSVERPVGIRNFTRGTFSRAGGPKPHGRYHE